MILFPYFYRSHYKIVCNTLAIKLLDAVKGKFHIPYIQIQYNTEKVTVEWISASMKFDMLNTVIVSIVWISVYIVTFRANCLLVVSLQTESIEIIALFDVFVWVVDDNPK